MNLVFMTYNNYYNRIIKKEDTMAAYDSIVTNSQEFYDIQFNPNDGVFTEQIVNWSVSWTPDYLVVYDDTAQPNVAIQSRWFVLEWVRTRGGQYKATLYRDSIADNYNTVIQSPMFIEKATIPFESDVAIYNTEDMQTNQIKSDEYLMKDETQSAWLVAYFAKNINFGTGEGQLNPHIEIPTPEVDAIHTNTLSSWEFNQYRTNYYKVIKDFNVEMKCSLFPSLYANAVGTIDTNGNSSIGTGSSVSYAAYCENVPTGAANRLNWVKTNLSPAIVSLKNTFLTYFLTNYDYHVTNNISQLDDKYLFVESGTDAGYYKIKVTRAADATEEGYFERNSNPVSTFNTAMNTATSGTWKTDTSVADSMTNVGRNVTYERYTITLTKETPVNTFVDFPLNPKLLTDAPYGMFVIPFNPITVYKYSSEAGEDIAYVRTPDQPYSTNFMTTIAEYLGVNIYDTQLLPYCPLRSILRSTANTVTVTGLTEHIDYEFIKQDLGELTIAKSIIFFCPQSKFTFDILKNLTIPRYVFDDTDDTYIEDLKIANQCDMYRLNSPNWAASFDFNLVKAGKSINEFNIDCLYKPYSPYIHINPKWRGLYNTDYDDYRGLICQGDFAIPSISDQWQQFMINNKNYLNAFNRQIESIELQNSVQKTKDIINAFTGTVTGSAAGALAGSKVGGAAGAAIGVAAGGLLSGVGGALDVYYNEMLRNDALDLTKDQFGYNLQNIQARPESLAKVSAFDNNNKVWPTLDYYTCTSQEKEALVNKMRYNGMTIGRIGKIEDFIDISKPQYIKGKLIRNTLIVDDYHVLTTIAEELNKGVFM